jgi:phage terminase large subunit-like protein
VWHFENKSTEYRYDYVEMADWLNKNYSTEKGRKFLHIQGKNDLFFLMYFILDIRPINHSWMVPKIYEIQDCHDRTLDLWSRELFKSTIMTFALPIWELIQNPEERIVIFSNTRDLAKDFLRKIKLALQNTQLLIKTYPTIFYANPEKESPKWSENDGLLIKRKGNFTEMSLEAWGVTENMPTGRHFTIRNYDDLVTWDSTRTGEQINKTLNGFQLSHALGVTEGGTVRIIGTRYDYNDLYSGLIKSGDWKVRLYRGDIQPSFWTEEQIQQKRVDYGVYNFSTQISLDPVSEDEQKFLMSWIKYHDGMYPETNDYIVVDPAGEKKDKSSFTVMWVVGFDGYKRAYVKDCVRDKLNLHERWVALRNLISKYPKVLRVGYEKYSMQADIGYIKEKQIEDKVFFDIQPLGGGIKKDDRIRGLIPLFEQGRILLPKEIRYTDAEGKNRNMIDEFLNDEYAHFPNISTKDMMDCLARITDMNLGVVYPNIKPVITQKKPEWNFFNSFTRNTNRFAWMGRA